jgi:excisionase family DNA binding protein
MGQGSITEKRQHFNDIMKQQIDIITKLTDRGICNPSGPRLLPLKKAADYLGLTVWAIRERVWSGALPVVRFQGGRKMYIDRLDLDSFIEQNKEVIT